jgi:hypothetical protein
MTDQQQLQWIASLPASKEAERLLKLSKAGRHPDLPALLALLQWAVEDAAPEMNLETGQAETILAELLDLALMGKPKAAVKILLNLDDPENELTPELTARTPKEAAMNLISLANQAAVK